MTNSCRCDNLPVLLHLGENGLGKYRLAKKWEQFKIVLLFMDNPVEEHSISWMQHSSATNEIIHNVITIFENHYKQSKWLIEHHRVCTTVHRSFTFISAYSTKLTDIRNTRDVTSLMSDKDGSDR